MVNKACAVMHWGDVVGVSPDGIVWVSPLLVLQKSRELICAHPNNRGVVVISENYMMPIIISNSELTEENRWASPKLVQKKPEIGDRVAYYPGNGNYAAKWAISPLKKSDPLIAKQATAT